MSVQITSAASTTAARISVGISAQPIAYIGYDNVDCTVIGIRNILINSPISFYSGVSPLPILFANTPAGQTYMGQLMIYYYAT